MFCLGKSDVVGEVYEETDASSIVNDKVYHLNYKDKDGVTSLMFQTLNDRLGVVLLLIQAGADATVGLPGNDTPYKPYQTPLILACREERLDMVKLLIDKGADVNATDTIAVFIIYCL
eukprot:GHVR01150177.1.p1 GENE.GHVR01150177.1~~GHVR01150177.1.p1  ORF type:complete len:130 (+),score=14.65 GHVR01150177.1:39-392(+)